MILNNEKGLTLAEITVVALLLAIMGVVVFGTITGMIRAKKSLESDREARRVALYLIQRLGEELNNRVELDLQGPLQSSPGSQNPDPTDPDPMQGDAFMIGKSLRLGELDADSIRFITLNTSGQTLDALQNHGLVEVEYRLEVSEGDLGLVEVGQRRGDKRRIVLVREEMPAGVNSQEVLRLRRAVLPITDQVVGLNFRYRFAGRWLNDWGTRQDGFPEAVEITVTTRGSDTGNVEVYKTAFALQRQAAASAN